MLWPPGPLGWWPPSPLPWVVAPPIPGLLKHLISFFHESSWIHLNYRALGKWAPPLPCSGTYFTHIYPKDMNTINHSPQGMIARQALGEEKSLSSLLSPLQLIHCLYISLFRIVLHANSAMGWRQHDQPHSCRQFPGQSQPAGWQVWRIHLGTTSRVDILSTKFVEGRIWVTCLSQMTIPGRINFLQASAAHIRTLKRDSLRTLCEKFSGRWTVTVSKSKHFLAPAASVLL